MKDLKRLLKQTVASELLKGASDASALVHLNGCDSQQVAQHSVGL